MDTLFFWASKIVWAFISPDSLLLILLLSATVMLFTQRHKWGRRLLAITCTALAFIAFFPVGEWLIAPLENRFPAQPDLPARIDGIIVLGGTINGATSAAWQQIDSNESTDRLHAFGQLAARYPNATLVFTGGSGSLTSQDIREADQITELTSLLGIDPTRLLTENASRNTWENARNSRAEFNPNTAENWVLITSAFHMPRSSGVFCAQSWATIAWPVDHRSHRGDLFRLEFRLAEHLMLLRTATREWVGLLAYRLSGKTTALLPGPTSQCKEF